VIIAKNAPKELEEGGQNQIDELVEINLETEEDPRPTYISASLPNDKQEQLTSFLREYIDCFAWNYHEMPGLDPGLQTQDRPRVQTRETGTTPNEGRTWRKSRIRNRSSKQDSCEKKKTPTG